MRILVTGANGFIGAHLAATLFGAGHEITACARNPNAARRQFPLYDWIGIDFNRDTGPSVWTPRLQDVDAVVNCAGILQGAAGQSLDAVHRDGPAALFDACVLSGVQRIVQISALGNDADAGTHYADSKRAADEYLKTLDIDWVILRPSLVYTAGVYGGTATLRGLAGFPFVVPLAGGGHQQFQPIHMDDLAHAVVRLVQADAPAQVSLDAVGPEPMELRNIVLGIRQWLGFRRTRIWPVPMGIVRLAAKFGDIAGWLFDRGTLRTTAIRQLEHGNTADPKPFAEAIGFTPRPFAHGLASTPSHVQDRWHARLAFLAPVLRVVFAAYLIESGVFNWLRLARDRLGTNQMLEELWGSKGMDFALLAAAGIYESASPILIAIFCLPLLFGLWVKKACNGILAISCINALVYSVLALSYPAQNYWAYVLGALLTAIEALVIAAISTKR